MSFPVPEDPEPNGFAAWCTSLKPGQQTEEEALEWLYGGKRAVEIRFRNDVLDEVVNELDEEAVLVPVDDYHFKTSMSVRLDYKFLSWVAKYDCYAKILAPQDIADYYLNWREKQLHHLNTLYQENLEPLGLLSLEEYDKLTDEQYFVPFLIATKVVFMRHAVVSQRSLTCARL